MATITDLKKVLKDVKYKGNIKTLCDYYNKNCKDYEKHGLKKSTILKNVIKVIEGGHKPNLMTCIVIADKIMFFTDNDNTPGAESDINKMSFQDLKKDAKNKGFQLTTKTTKKILIEFLSNLEEE